jgi:amidase
MRWKREFRKVDGEVNALPILCFDRARDQADALMKKAAH